jgi:hypothetical protein
MPFILNPADRYAQKYTLLREYKFVVAFENTQEWDYVTEKMYHGLDTGAVPVYWGAPNADYFTPLNSVVNVDDFKSARELAFHLINLKHNCTAYAKYMAWRTGDVGQHFRRLLLYSQRTHPICSLFSRIHNLWINPYLTIWARNVSSDSSSRALDCIQCTKSYTGPVLPKIYQSDFEPTPVQIDTLIESTYNQNQS